LNDSHSALSAFPTNPTDRAFFLPKFLLDTKPFFNDYYNVMNKNNLSREYLESISTADLISLADYYGIDIPENLNRRFIIGDLLEVAEEIQAKEENEENVIIAKGELEIPENLPKTYNETKIRAVLHNPAWAFVFWDTRNSLQGENGTEGMFLHVCIFSSNEDESPTDFFDIQAPSRCGEQYVLLPPGTKSFAIELKIPPALPGEKPEIIAFTEKIQIPQENPVIAGIKPGQKVQVPPMVSLSGFEQLLSAQFREHRESFA